MHYVHAACYLSVSHLARLSYVFFLSPTWTLLIDPDAIDPHVQVHVTYHFFSFIIINNHHKSYIIIILNMNHCHCHFWFNQVSLFDSTPLSFGIDSGRDKWRTYSLQQFDKLVNKGSTITVSVAQVDCSDRISFVIIPFGHHNHHQQTISHSKLWTLHTDALMHVYGPATKNNDTVTADSNPLNTRHVTAQHKNNVAWHPVIRRLECASTLWVVLPNCLTASRQSKVKDS